jgi:hypothetical protein
MSENERILREKATIEKMIEIYCKNKHSEEDLCEDCKELLEYTEKRLSSCKFGEGKPICGKCQVHCYKPAMRVKVQNVMKYSGPKMIFHYPKLTIMHFVDSLVKKKVTNL